MHGRKSCWEVIEESLFKYHKNKGHAMFPLFKYVSGHFKFFHNGSDMDLIEEYNAKLAAWKQHITND